MDGLESYLTYKKGEASFALLRGGTTEMSDSESLDLKRQEELP